VEDDEVWLYDAHIDAYSHGNIQNHHQSAAQIALAQSEIRKLFGLASVKGNALVPSPSIENAGKSGSPPSAKAKSNTTNARPQARDAERELKRAAMQRLKGR